MGFRRGPGRAGAGGKGKRSENGAGFRQVRLRDLAAGLA
jgi:hypothetical protein